MFYNKQKLSDDNYIIWEKLEKLEKIDIEEIVSYYLQSAEFRQLQHYNNYYDVENSRLKHKVNDRHRKDVTPNEFTPTAYYKTVVDTMSGFMSSNISYETDEASQEQFIDELNTLLDINDTDVKDMKSTINALAFNKGIEIVYTTGDGKTSPQIKFTSIDPRQMCLVYNNNIEPDLFCALRITSSTNKDYDYNIDVIYADEWQYYYMKNGEIKEREQSRPLFFSECPVVVYRAEIVQNRSPFHQILNYIDALDALVTGNTNDIQKLADAILKLSLQLEDDDIKHLDQLKVIGGLAKEDIAEYITKDMSPEFRRYVSELFIKEIHKHSHTVDWFSDSTGSNEASARALRVRLFDMMTYSKRIEKVIVKGFRKRINLIAELMNKAKGIEPGDIKIIFNREMPDNFLDLAPVLNQLTILSTERKLEMLGEDVQAEKERLDAEKESNMQMFENNMRTEEDEEEQE